MTCVCVCVCVCVCACVVCVVCAYAFVCLIQGKSAFTSKVTGTYLQQADRIHLVDLGVRDVDLAQM